MDQVHHGGVDSLQVWDAKGQVRTRGVGGEGSGWNAETCVFQGQDQFPETREARPAELKSSGGSQHPEEGGRGGQCTHDSQEETAESGDPEDRGLNTNDRTVPGAREHPHRPCC